LAGEHETKKSSAIRRHPMKAGNYKRFKMETASPFRIISHRVGNGMRKNASATSVDKARLWISAASGEGMALALPMRGNLRPVCRQDAGAPSRIAAMPAWRRRFYGTRNHFA
jgi:hypothetical protein